MSDVESGLQYLKIHDEYEDGIPVTVRDIHPFVIFNHGWVEPELFYETPEATFELESPIGDIYAPLRIHDTIDGNLAEILEYDAERGAGQSVRSLIGEQLCLFPNEDLTMGTLWPDGTTAPEYIDEKAVALKENGRVHSEDRDWGGDGTPEPRSIEWFDRMVAVERERMITSNDGWLERTIESVEADDDTIRVWVKVFDDWLARWRFDNTPQGYQSLREFVSYLGAPEDISQLEGETVYLHPVRSFSIAELRSEVPLDALERWVIAGEPLQEDSTIDHPLLGRITGLLGRFRPSRDRVEVSIVTSENKLRARTGTRYANSSDDSELPDYSQPSQSIEDSNLQHQYRSLS